MRLKSHVPRARAPLFALAIAALAVMTAAEPAAAATVTTFSDGSSSKTVYLPSGGGSDSTVQIQIPKNSYPTAATLTVRGGPDNGGNYPFAPEVYLANPGNRSQIYGFGGTGYGSMGLQTSYANGSLTSPMSFSGAGSDSTTTLLLPFGASVTAAQVSVTGEPLDLGFSGPETVNTQIGNNNLQINTGNRSAPYLVDIDNDGDLDLFVAGGDFSSWNEPYGGGPRFFRNNGSATAWQFREETGVMRRVQMGYGFSPALADLDGDGDYDLLTVGGYYNPLVRFYWNDGTASLPSWSQNNSVFSGVSVDAFSHAAFADLDGDGDQDLTIGMESGGLTYYRNTGTSTYPAWTTANIFAGISVSTSAAPSFADYDGDGDLDLFLGNGTYSWSNFGEGTESIKYYENTGSASSPSFSLGTLTNGMHVGGVYTDTNLVPFVADMDDDGDMDMLVGDYDGRLWVYLGQRSSPRDLGLDVGADGTTDWSMSGILSGTHTASGLAAAFNAALQVGAPAPDQWGNRMVTVRIRVTTAAAGIVKLTGLQVHYNYTATSVDFATALNNVRVGTPADGAGNVLAAVPVRAASAGAVTLGGLQVTLNMPPTVTVPAALHLSEDTKVDNLLDLSSVFVDDLPSGPALSYTVTSNSNPANVEVYITTGGLYLGADALNPPQSDNWYGAIVATVEARDNYGLTASATISIVVDPVNDAPVLGGILPDYTISEDAPWQLAPTVLDVDGDSVTWTATGLPAGASFDASSGKISWTPLNADVGTHTVTLVATDGKAPVTALLRITVVNVNDPPYLLQIPDQTVKEDVPLFFDLSPYYGDEDDTALELNAGSAHATLTGTILKIFFAKGEGIGAERVRVSVYDPQGLSATGAFVVTVIPVGPDLALVGVPDQQVVEGSAKTIDIAPYLYNVENWDNVTVATSSPHITVAGTKVTFLYPVGFPADTESVKISASEGKETAAWTISVTIVRLGQAVLIADLPDLDIAADEEMVLDLAPYIHNVDAWDAVVVTEDSSYVTVSGLTLRLLYPRASGVTGENILVAVTEGGETSNDEMSVRVRQVGREFYLDPVAPINVVEGQPYVLFLTSYIHNADPVTGVELFVSSSHATADGQRIEFLYPVGGGIEHEQVAVLARFGAQSFQTVISVSVAALGDAFALAGVPNLAVYANTPYTISMQPYLYNVPGGDIGIVVLAVDSASVGVEGLQLRFLFAGGPEVTHETVTITATAGGDTSAQTITVTVKPLGTRLTVAPIPDLHITEDHAITLDIADYILNARGDVTVTAESAFVTVSDGTILTFSYPGGVPADEVVVTIQDRTSSAQGSIRVVVTQRNDAPFSKGAPQNFSVAPGTTLTWDLAALFGDEEHPEGLLFAASDPRVVIDNTLRRATFVVPEAGEFTFTFGAIDAENRSLSALSPPARVIGVAGGGGGGGGVQAQGSGDVAFPLLAILLAAGAAMGIRRLGGSILGARADGPTLRRRE